MRFFFALCLWYSLCADNIVFVHLGETIPGCIYTVMRQARYFNPDCHMYLLVDEKAAPLFEKEQTFFAEERIERVQIQPSTLYQKFLAENKIDSAITKGLWVYSTERFFALCDFMQQRNLRNVLHLESDTMLYASLQELLPQMQAFRLATPFQSRVGCIPCFVFIRDAESLAPLLEHILQTMGEYKGNWPHIYLNDMQTLASFYAKCGAEALLPLPTLMPEYDRRKRKSVFPSDNRTELPFLSAHSSQFPGMIFDAAGLGIWINGNDGRYSHPRGPGTVHSRCLFHPGDFAYFWGTDARGRPVPYLSFKGNKYRILNLHFYSKRPDDYASFNETRQEFSSR